ncbi:MAG: hypothetical protein ACQEQF_08125 [Bacillota bacterium]
MNANNKPNGFTKEILSEILEKYVFGWVCNSCIGSDVNLSKVIDNFGHKKMDLIKYEVESMIEKDNNIEFVYEEIKDFNEFRDLLKYLSPKSYDTSESTLLEFIRGCDKITIVEHKKDDIYKCYFR